MVYLTCPLPLQYWEKEPETPAEMAKVRAGAGTVPLGMRDIKLCLEGER